MVAQLRDEGGRLRRRNEPLATEIGAALEAYEYAIGPLPGIGSPERRSSFVGQLVDSVRRNKYVEHIVHADLNSSRMDPLSGKFDPLKAAVLRRRAGEDDEAFWMLFLFVHFGRHRTAGWRYAADVYGRLGNGSSWDWVSVSRDVDAFRDWLEANEDALRGPPGSSHGFGNHRKYESLSGWSDSGTGAAVATYVEWVGASHTPRFATALADADGDPMRAFAILNQSMRSVRRFGRVARFDYLSMAGKLGLAIVRPDSAHLGASTGPLAGARLLFEPCSASENTAAALDGRVIGLEEYLNLGFDVLEDALCNWQKSPSVFKPFRG